MSFVITASSAARVYSAGDVALGEDIAQRVAMAIDNARLHWLRVWRPRRTSHPLWRRTRQLGER